MALVKSDSEFAAKSLLPLATYSLFTKMSIYIMTHKKATKPADDFYKMLQVGAYKGHINADCYDDDGPDNISKKNANYCELTGVYWIWKNVKDDIIGIVHYRRFFSTTYSGRIINKSETEKLLKKYDIILPNRTYLRESVADQLKTTFPKNELEILKEAISMHFPEYLSTYENVMERNMVYFCNMLIAKKEIHDKYCEWLFKILEEVEKHIDYSDYTGYQKRIFGFLSERLLTVWVTHNNIKVCELGLWCPESKDNPIKNALVGIRRVYSYHMPDNRVVDNMFKMTRKSE